MNFLGKFIYLSTSSVICIICFSPYPFLHSFICVIRFETVRKNSELKNAKNVFDFAFVRTKSRSSSCPKLLKLEF